MEQEDTWCCQTGIKMSWGKGLAGEDIFSTTPEVITEKMPFVEGNNGSIFSFV
jgi:hypothetical protein